MTTSVLDRAWKDQSSWSQTADHLKSGLERWRRLALGLALLGAVLSALAVVVGLDSTAGKLAAFGSGAAVAVAGIVRARTGTHAIRDWTRARSVSEAIKSDVYTYLATGGDDGALETSIEEIERDGDDLLRYKNALAPRQRPLPEVHDIKSYLEIRVRGQINGYYRKRAEELERKVKLVRWIELGLGIAGAVLAVAAGTWEEDGLAVWVPVVTTVAAAITAHAAAARYEYLIVEYLRTAAELERLSRREGRAARLSEYDLVAEAERVISIQNEGWMAKLTSEAAEG